jgi:hypothetical protein
LQAAAAVAAVVSSGSRFVIKMRGIPFSAREPEVIQFLAPASVGGCTRVYASAHRVLT